MKPLRDFITENQIEAMVIADGYDDAFLGVAYQSGEPIAVYSYEMCIQILMRDNNLTYNDAVETFEFNTVDAVVPNGPLFVHMAEHIFKSGVKPPRGQHLVPRFYNKVDDCPEDWLGL